MIVAYGESGKVVKNVKRSCYRFYTFYTCPDKGSVIISGGGNKMKRHDFGGQWMNCCIIMSYF